MTVSSVRGVFSPADTGQRRRASDPRPVIGDLIDEAMVEAIAQEAWIALVGEDEVLLPVPAALPPSVVSSWVDVVGPWAGSVVLTTGHATAEELCRALFGPATPPVPDADDVADAFGEIANVVGGNVKAALPGPSALGLPRVGRAPVVGDPADLVLVDLLWRGAPIRISVQGALPALPDRPTPSAHDPENEVHL